MLVLIAFAAICLALIALLRTKGPMRAKRSSGPITWQGGRRQLSEDAAREMVLRRLRNDED